MLKNKRNIERERGQEGRKERGREGRWGREKSEKEGRGGKREGGDNSMN